MNILTVTQSSVQGGIEFADLDSLKNAIRVFADGGTPAARETNRHGFDDTPNGGVGLLMKMDFDNRRESSFIQELLSEIDRVTESRQFSKSYDYDGAGPFFKTSVEVKKIKIGRRRFTYLLSLYASYVGDRPCAGLASSLDADRALWRDEVVIEMAPVGDRFEIDFEAAAERLAGIGLDSLTGQQIADSIMAEAPKGHEANTNVLIRRDDLVVGFGLMRVSVQGPIDHKSGEVIWIQSGAIISGPLERAIEGEGYAKPRLSVSISVPKPENERSWERKPILDPVVKQNVHDQTAAIVSAFQ
jgi:hypothetical protein